MSGARASLGLIPASHPLIRSPKQELPMTVTIRTADLIESVADALQFISYYHPMDYIRALGAAYEAEQGPAAKDAIAQILTNSRMCAEGHRPICQDTGIVNVFVKWGMDCRLDDTSKSLQEVVDEGVRRAYLHPENKLRASVLADPAFTRRNTKDNTPCVLHVELVPGDHVSIDVAAKGGGSENKSKFKMMNPSDNIVDWVLEMLPQMARAGARRGCWASASAARRSIACCSPSRR